ncbi:MAG: NAD(P)H-dependent oxidoreductase [Chloroflexaceae bacterium]|nr:NAD(P)H-dependent oxidoreductase [Chloroflexaceae bacterium]
MNDTLQVLGLSGSLRQKSYNTALLRAAAQLAPADITITIYDLRAIPFYNEDIRVENDFPDAVEDLRQRIRMADGLLFASPEYNASITGVLKNAIDWASRQPDSPLMGKPVGLIGASMGGFGTVRGQAHLRDVCHGTGMLAMSRPEIMISRVQEHIDDHGTLIQEQTKQQLQTFVSALAHWVRRLQTQNC